MHVETSDVTVEWLAHRGRRCSCCQCRSHPFNIRLKSACTKGIIKWALFSTYVLGCLMIVCLRAAQLHSRYFSGIFYWLSVVNSGTPVLSYLMKASNDGEALPCRALGDLAFSTQSMSISWLKSLWRFDFFLSFFPSFFLLTEMTGNRIYDPVTSFLILDPVTSFQIFDPVTSFINWES